MRERLLNFVNSKRTQGGVTLFWVAMLPIATLTGLIHSVDFISYLSLWALIASHGAWWAAAGVAEEDVAEQVVDQVVEETDVQRER